MKDDLNYFIDFLIGGALSIVFVFTGKYDNDTLYIVGLFMYLHVFLSLQRKYDRLKRRLKRYQKATESYIRLTEFDYDGKE